MKLKRINQINAFCERNEVIQLYKWLGTDKVRYSDNWRNRYYTFVRGGRKDRISISGNFTYGAELIFEWLINAPGSRNAKKVIDCLSNISLFTLSSKLNYCTESGVEYYIGQSSDKAVILAFIHDESIYFIDKNELREMALTAKVKGINHVTLYTNYGLELHSKYETPFTVGMNVIEKIALN